MAPYNPMKKHMEKLDEWGSSQAKRLNAQRDAGSGTSMSDRLNMARGRDTRWETSKKPNEAAAGEEGDDPNNIVPNRSARVGHLPPAPATVAGKSRPPPPPPQRNGSGPAPPPPARSAAGSTPSTRPAPPALPRRMDNESGTPHPPPPYPAAAPSPPSRRAMASSEESGMIEFSKFGPQDKQVFFDMLDEYFAARSNSTGKSSRSAASRSSAASPTADTNPLMSTFAKAAASTFSKRSESAPKPSGPSPKASIQLQTKTSRSGPTRAKPATTSHPSWSYPRLTASAHPATELCKALTCASFFAYRASYPEWSGAQPWFTQQNAIPSTLQGRRDIAWSSSSMYRGNDYTMMGATLFDDLSCLWWRVSWNKTNPSASVNVDAAYRDPPSAWADEERLTEAARGFGDWIAGFAEQAERSKQPVGDGECWTLAAEAIKYTNSTAQLTPDNRLLTSIGRTHGHLIYAAEADPVKGQCGRWRGGDRVRERWGGIRRGDIVEWRTAKCRELNGPPGSYVTLGAPEHTAVILNNAPVPERLSHSNPHRAKAKEQSYYSLLGLKPSATQAEIRSAYLSAARRHHPDRQRSALDDDDHIQQLNEANETLSDPTRRARYDDELQSGLVGRKGMQSNSTRVSATIDLDSMEVVEGDVDGRLTFSHPCRCGSGFYVDEDQLQSQARPVIQCSGCSERIRVVSGQGQADEGVDAEDEAEEDDEDDCEDQPELLPWELGSFTTIEQSAGQVPTRRTYDLALDSFTQGELWIYRPCWEKEMLGGAVQPGWPPNLPGWQPIAQ